MKAYVLVILMSLLTIGQAYSSNIIFEQEQPRGYNLQIEKSPDFINGVAFVKEYDSDNNLKSCKVIVGTKDVNRLGIETVVTHSKKGCNDND